MKLIKLSCSESSFHTIKFNPEGLSLIIGDGSKNDNNEEGNSNGVGKTLALGLVHHCLGANVEDKIKKAVPKWIFSLTILISGKYHTIERSGDGKHIALDGGKLGSVSALRNWLKDSGIFLFHDNINDIGFRSFIKRFARYQPEDCSHPISLKKEQDFEARLRTLYLLGIDCSLVISKRDNKIQSDLIKKNLKIWQENDPVLSVIFRAGSNAKVRLEWLEKEVIRLKTDLEKFQVAEDYRAIELHAGILTKEMREFEKQIAIYEFQLDGINKALIEKHDISRAELINLYGGLQSIFKPDALQHLSDVENFHNTIIYNRKIRLERDAINIGLTIKQLEKERKEATNKRDEYLQMIQGKRALDEYATAANQLAQYIEEKKRLTDFLEYKNNLEQQAQSLREKKVEEDGIASAYIVKDPIAFANKKFHELAEIFYPKLASGIVIDNNTGDSSLRYDIAIQIEGDASDGINAAKIICFDWLVFMYGTNHAMQFLWHDNRLFAHIDPGSRAKWLTYVMNVLENSGKQYIASMNMENYDATASNMSPEGKKLFEQSIILRLKGDSPVNKLLGIQFGY